MRRLFGSAVFANICQGTAKHLAFLPEHSSGACPKSISNFIPKPDSFGVSASLNNEPGTKRAYYKSHLD
jgi:hypothetical protein